MKVNCDRKLIRYISENWDDDRKGQEVQEMLEAIVAELKKDFREYQRRHSRISDEAIAHWEGLICDVQNRDFWDKFDHLLDFGFEF